MFCKLRLLLEQIIKFLLQIKNGGLFLLGVVKLSLGKGKRYWVHCLLCLLLGGLLRCRLSKRRRNSILCAWLLLEEIVGGDCVLRSLRNSGWQKGSLGNLLLLLLVLLNLLLLWLLGFYSLKKAIERKLLTKTYSLIDCSRLGCGWVTQIYYIWERLLKLINLVNCWLLKSCDQFFCLINLIKSFADVC